MHVKFYQIAETDSDRIVLGNIDYSCHDYPYVLLFKGAYNKIPKWRLYAAIIKESMLSKADFVLIAGYHAPEYWLQLACLILKGTKRGVFCDATIFDRPRTSHPKEMLKRIFFHFCDAVFCYGERSRTYLKLYGVSDDRIFIRCQAAALPNNYSEELILAKRMRKVSEATRLLYVGRLAPEKNIIRLIDAFAAYVHSHPEATLRIVGDGPLKEDLLTYVNLVECRGIVWIGSLSGEALVNEYLSATALVLPSLSEPWGLVVNEAMAYGCPVIVSNRCGCVPEMVVENETGCQFDPLDTSEMTRKIEFAVLNLRGKAVSERCIKQASLYKSRDAAVAICNGVVRMVGPVAS